MCQRPLADEFARGSRADSSCEQSAREIEGSQFALIFGVKMAGWLSSKNIRKMISKKVEMIGTRRC